MCTKRAKLWFIKQQILVKKLTFLGAARDLFAPKKKTFINMTKVGKDLNRSKKARHEKKLYKL